MQTTQLLSQAVALLKASQHAASCFPEELFEAVCQPVLASRLGHVNLRIDYTMISASTRSNCTGWLPGVFICGPACLCHAADGDHESQPVLQQHCQAQAVAALWCPVAPERR